MNPWTKRIEKTVIVTITLNGVGDATFDFLEPESGDQSRITTPWHNREEEECRVGGELLSWLSLMKDEMDTVNEEG